MTPLEALAAITASLALSAACLLTGYTIGAWWVNRTPRVSHDLPRPIRVRLHADVERYADAMRRAAGGNAP